jgi:predicted nucleic-acid-binding Zn-ribbon protein
MTKANLSAVRWIDLGACLATPCSGCRHSEFIHADTGPCLFSACTCPRFFPVADDLMPNPDDSRTTANIDPLRPSKQDGSTRVLCATCGHSEFVHADNGDRRCRYSVCDCDRFVLDAGLDSRHMSFLP